MIHRMLGAALTALVLVGSLAADEKKDLAIGDPAPKLELGKFIKGDPVSGIEAGKVYVVEFWATWCGPCIAAMPHLSELQKKHPDVVIVSITDETDDAEKVEEFVKGKGETMSYRVVFDKETDGGHAMNKNYLRAAGQDGIPCAFIVNKESKIAWIGHPMQMDGPLAKIVEGSWDVVKAAADFKKAASLQKKLQSVMQKLIPMVQGGKMDDAMTMIDEEAKKDKEVGFPLSMLKFQILSQTGAPSEKIVPQMDAITELVTEKDQAEALNQIAWMVVDPDRRGPKPDEAMLKAALKAAEKADKLTEEKSSAIADTYAKCLFDNGQIKKAVEVQERAVKLSKGTEFEKDPSLKKRLEEYKAKAAGAKG
jgi:thiol-disulfide isomerase/thioredoxin